MSKEAKPKRARKTRRPKINNPFIGIEKTITANLKEMEITATPKMVQSFMDEIYLRAKDLLEDSSVTVKIINRSLRFEFS